MQHHDAPCRIREHLSIQQIGTETLIYDGTRHQAFCLNQSSSVIWYLANGENSVAHIAAQASLQLWFAVTEDFVLFALEELSHDGLIKQWSRDVGSLEISRRRLLQHLGTGSALLLPAVAAILAPTAAQAYSGCVDCSVTQATKAKKRQTAGPSQ